MTAGSDDSPAGTPYQLKDVLIQTLWRTASEQCELVFLGMRGCRLRLWVKGVLVVDEEAFDWTAARRRAAELRSNGPASSG
jgi:hypothetical protein